jgi:hypothetical protein
MDKIEVIIKVRENDLIKTFPLVEDLHIDHFYDALKTGVVHFKYKKINGEVRNAFGTLKQELLPVRDEPTTKVERKSLNINYFDVEVGAWRSLDPTRLLCVIH